MSVNLKIMALVPARAGSKRVKEKNMRLLGGIPLIGHKIKAALKSEYINKIVVSTDSEKIRAIAEEYRVKVPFLRPPEISGDNSTELEFHQHALNWLREKENYIPGMQWIGDDLMLIQHMNRHQNTLTVWSFTPSTKSLKK